VDNAELDPGLLPLDVLGVPGGLEVDPRAPRERAARVREEQAADRVEALRGTYPPLLARWQSV